MEDHFSVADMPSIVATQILSYLDWNEKLNTIVAIPTWKPHLQTSAAWVIVNYEKEFEENVYFAREKRAALLFALKVYGRSMKRIHISFAYKLGQTGLQILHAVAECCSALQKFSVSQELYKPELYATSFWKKRCAQAICSIFENCKCLIAAGIRYPVIDWSDASENNLVLVTIHSNLADRVTQLELTSNSLIEHEGHLRELVHFTHLKQLTIRREKINNDIIMSLVKCNLQEIKLYQDEEIALADARQLSDEVWSNILKICPNFKVDLVLRYILVIKDSFAVHMPLRNLVLDDLVNIVTKGVMDYFVANYKHCLESFTYTNSYLENFETGDSRLPAALVDMVIQCQNLQTLRYGFPLSSTTVLLIAHERKLETFEVNSVEVSYEFDWPVSEEWDESFVQWLKVSGRNERSLEAAVSQQLGNPWKLMYENMNFFNGNKDLECYL